MNIKAVFFDLDDTLYDQHKPFLDAIKEVFPNIANKISIEELYKKSRYYSDLLWKDYTLGKMSLEDVRIQRILLALKDAGFIISKDEAFQFQKQYNSALANIQAFPDAGDLFTKLTLHGLKLGIITNGPGHHQFQKIKNLGLLEHIPMENVLISDDVGHAKPHPKIFEEACKKGGWSPNELLYVGDSWGNDVAASIEAGWNAIWFNYRRRQPETNHQPLKVVDSLLKIWPLT
jgi:HAD superfamily hydrolase (TIGR01549 family)